MGDERKSESGSLAHTTPMGHWDKVYREKSETEVSWFQAKPTKSLDFIARSELTKSSPIIDIGGGASRLIDHLLNDGYTDLTVLDIAEPALAQSKARLTDNAAVINWIVNDITTWVPPRIYDLWHDRAVFHFLTGQQARDEYKRALTAATHSGSNIIIATFALNGPDRCSGLPVVRYSPQSLAAEFGDQFALIDHMTTGHRTPGGGEQAFQYSRFQVG